MNNNQKVFEAVTGFKASYLPRGASQDYDETDYSEIEAVVQGTIDNAEDVGIDLDDSDINAKSIASAILAFHDCDTGCGSDLDAIFSAL